jgi:hypothetical protein
MFASVLRGVAAGAAGTTALNTVTYLDMALRGRPSSPAPEQTVETLAEKASVDIPGERETRDNRLGGAGALLGLLTGVGVGAAYGMARGLGWRPSFPAAAVVTGLAAMAGSVAPMAALGVTDPRQWSAVDWISDVVPHLAYGVVTASAY